jgi:carboxyl-terminal processing protease
MRSFWIGVGILSLIGLAFGAGYVSYPLLHGVFAPTTLSTDSSLDRNDPNVSVYWEAWQILERDFYGIKPDTSARTYGAIRGLVESFDDPHTYFLEPQPRRRERDDLRGSFGGIGAAFERTSEGYLLHPLEERPAAQAGIQAGDLLLMVDDQEITPDVDEDSIMLLVRGPVGTEVVLVVRRIDEQDKPLELTFKITRAEIETPSLEWHMLEPIAGEPSSVAIGYIRHTLFSERSPAEMRQAVEELIEQGATGFILDLRGNPGGLVSSAVAVADLWLDSGLVFMEQRADGSENQAEAKPGDVAEDYPLVVIVDGGSASASEIVAGALQDHGRAWLVGEQTFGKGSVQLIHELPDQSSIHVTHAQWYTPNRRAISANGLTPDYLVAPEVDPLPEAIALLLETPLPQSVAGPGPPAQ